MKTSVIVGLIITVILCVVMIMTLSQHQHGTQSFYSDFGPITVPKTCNSCGDIHFWVMVTIAFAVPSVIGTILWEEL